MMEIYQASTRSKFELHNIKYRRLRHLEQKYILRGSQKRKVLIRALRLTLVCITWSHFGHLNVECACIDRGLLGKHLL